MAIARPIAKDVGTGAAMTVDTAVVPALRTGFQWGLYRTPWHSVRAGATVGADA